MSWYLSDELPLLSTRIFTYRASLPGARAVMAATFTMSDASQPRDRSFTGLHRPWRTGPYALALARRSVSL